MVKQKKSKNAMKNRCFLMKSNYTECKSHTNECSLLNKCNLLFENDYFNFPINKSY